MKPAATVWVSVQIILADELLVVQQVSLNTSQREIVSWQGVRVMCDVCQEEIINQREVMAESLRTLDTFPIRQIPNITDGHAIHRISMLSAMLERLNGLILRHIRDD